MYSCLPNSLYFINTPEELVWGLTPLYQYFSCRGWGWRSDPFCSILVIIADTTSHSHHITDQINILSNLRELEIQEKCSSVYVERSEVDVRSKDFCNSCQDNVLLQSRSDILSELACLKAQPSEIERENGRAQV